MVEEPLGSPKMFVGDLEPCTTTPKAEIAVVGGLRRPAGRWQNTGCPHGPMPEGICPLKKASAPLQPHLTTDWWVNAPSTLIAVVGGGVDPPAQR